MFCEKCGNKIEENNKFCDKCGTLTTRERKQVFNKKVFFKNNSSERIIRISKSILLFILVWIVVYWFMNIFTKSCYDEAFFQSFALSVLIVFIYKKIAKKYL